MNPSFNLLDEKWLPVRYVDGRVEEIGLLQLFSDSNQISGLAETAPPNLIALYRLLLAITHRALARQFGSWTVRDMARYYQEGLPVAAIHEYLEQWRERFFVFHPEFPFMQVAALATAEETCNKSKSWSQIALACSNGNAPVLFDHSVDTASTAISAGLAICHLLGFLQFTPGGLVKMLRDSDKAGALANTAAALPVGDNVSQTLALALHPSLQGAVKDLPAWEKMPPDIAALCGEPTLVSGPNDRYTRLSRAVLFLSDTDAGKQVSHLRFAAGVALAEDEHAPDLMASYRAGSNGMVRLGFSDGRAIWRDLPTLLPDPSGKHALPAAVLSFANELLNHAGAADKYLSVMVLGLASDQAKLLRWRAEQFLLPQCLLSQDDAAAELRKYLQQAEEISGKLRKAGTTMLAKAMPDSEHKDTRSRARAMYDNGPASASYFSGFERNLPRLLDLIAANDLDGADAHWNAAQLSAARDAWESVCRQLGDNARALRARAQAEPFYFSLIKPLRAESESTLEEVSYV